MCEMIENTEVWRWGQSERSERRKREGLEHWAMEPGVPFPGSPVESMEGDHVGGFLPLQRGSQALGNPGIIPQRLWSDHGISAAENDSTPETKGPGAQPRDRDLSVDCMEGPMEGSGCWGRRASWGPVPCCPELLEPLPFSYSCLVEHSNGRILWLEGGFSSCLCLVGRQKN